MPFAELLLVRLAGEVRRRRDHQRDRVVGHVGHVSRISEDQLIDTLVRTLIVRRQVGRREAIVEGSSIVAFTSTDAECRGARAVSLCRSRSGLCLHAATLRAPCPWAGDTGLGASATIDGVPVSVDPAGARPDHRPQPHRLQRPSHQLRPRRQADGTTRRLLRSVGGG